ncbi:MAG: hypothetical protein ACTSRW_17445 [Candidatus Helarchaeota archaeon]
MHSFGEVPDDVRSKYTFPLLRNLFPVFLDLGWEYYEKGLQKLTPMTYDLMRIRLNESIQVTRSVMSGKITPEMSRKILCYTIMPSIVITRSDLMQGTMKLLYGESTDCAFNLINDANAEIQFTLNSHLEEGIPADWYILGQDDEVFQRRHIKLGVKLKDIPKKIKKFVPAGIKTLDILRDVRNERMPQFSTSAYIGAMSWISTAVNIIMELSVYENHGLFHDGVNAQSSYGLPDFSCCFTPFPPLLRTLFSMKRHDFISKMAGLFTGHLLYLSGVNETPINWLKQELPEIFESWKKNVESRGFPFPATTLKAKTPTKDQLKEKNLDKYKQAEKLSQDMVNDFWSWPAEDKWIQLSDMGMETIEEVLRGVLLDVTHETAPTTKVTKENIISIGIGQDTKFLK